MPNIKETMAIIEHTPCDQPILLVGDHGIGKSEIIRDHFTAKGYKIIILFAGQMADAGDLIGLPDRVEAEIELIDSNGKTYKEKIKYTDFNPPKWWPQNMDDKLIIFLDEVNRGKPEIMQCLMDMILNRKLNGRSLPMQTRIIGAMNPIKDGYYQVEELDPAFYDRWNVYDLKPTIEEWMFWAIRRKPKRIHEDVMGFISKHNDHLDPPSSETAKSGNVYPSRRSWTKVSNFLDEIEDMESGKEKSVLIQNYLNGVVGLRTASAYNAYTNEKAMGVSARMILTNWDDKYIAEIKSLNIQQQIHVNLQLAIWFEQHEEELKIGDVGKYSHNLKKYLELIDVECMALFFGMMADAEKNKSVWQRLILDAEPKLSQKFIDVFHGSDDEEEKEWE